MAVNVATRLAISCGAALLLLVVMNKPVPADIFEDVVGFWNFDDGDATDISPFGNHGTVPADVGISFSDDTPFGGGQSLSLTGGNSAVNVPHSESLAFPEGMMTLALWMKASSAQENAWGGAISKMLPSEAGWETQQFDLEEEIDLRIDTGPAPLDNQNVAQVAPAYTGEWNHLAWTLDNGAVNTYLNGELLAEAAYEHGDGFSNENPLLIGSRTGYFTLVGLLDDVGLWDVVLTAEEVAFLASGPFAPMPFVPGDVNEDRQTDDIDFDIMQRNFGATGDVFSMGDANKDGEVELLDFRIIKANQGCFLNDSDQVVCGDGAQAATANAPEPASVTLAVLAFVAAAAARCRRQP